MDKSMNLPWLEKIVAMRRTVETLKEWLDSHPGEKGTTQYDEVQKTMWRLEIYASRLTREDELIITEEYDPPRPPDQMLRD